MKAPVVCHRDVSRDKKPCFAFPFVSEGVYNGPATVRENRQNFFKNMEKSGNFFFFFTLGKFYILDERQL